MPSPVGHALAGAAIAWSVLPTPLPSTRSGAATAPARPPIGDALLTLTGACMALAAAPDLDLLLPGTHRTFTHGIGAVLTILILAIAVTGKVTRWLPPLSGRARALVVSAMVAAFASHLLMDWLGADDTPPRGLQLLSPFSSEWFISGWDLFRGTARRHPFSAASMRTNALALAQEIATMGPVAAAAWLVRVKTAAGLAAEVSRGDHAAQ